MLGIHRLPYGDLQGRTAVGIDVGELDLEDDLSLLRAVIDARVPGAAAVRLKRAPWGDSKLDRALTMLAADGRTEGLEVLALRGVSETRWSPAPVWWVFDATALFEGVTGSHEVVQRAAALPFLPSPAEVVIFEPQADAISAAALDEVATMLDPAAGWIYAEKGSSAARKAERETARASTPWGVRWTEAG